VDSDGVIRSAATNLLLRSEEFDNASWSRVRLSTVNANGAVSPNGTLSADEMVVDTANGTHSIYSNTISSTTATYSASVYLKAGTSNFAFFGLTDLATGGAERRINLSTGVVDTVNIGGAGSWTSVSSTVASVGNGWYRLTVTATQGGGTSVALQVLVGNSSGQRTYLGNNTDSVYAWGAQLELGSTATTYIPTGATINSAPRFDHNPLTGECLGLLVEESRTNSIRNNTMVGAVAGTPGTLPTNWSESLAGLTREVVGTGTTNGINWIDLRLSGTSTGTVVNLSMEAINVAVAAAGQNWTNSFWIARVGGTTTNVTGVNSRIRSYNSTPAFLGQHDGSAITLTSSLVRHEATYSNLPATTAFVEPVVRVVVANSSAIDITLRIGLPQLEQGAFATSVIPTTGTAVTRSADIATLSGTNFSSWYFPAQGTLFASMSSASGAAYTGYVLSVGPDFNNTIQMYRQSDTQPVARVRVGGVDTYGSIGSGPVWTGTTLGKFALALSPSSGRQAFNGTLDSAGDDLNITLPVSSSMSIGSLAGSSIFANAHIRRIAYFDRRLPNATLQAITT
jgi:hypothetical protein